MLLNVKLKVNTLSLLSIFIYPLYLSTTLFIFKSPNPCSVLFGLVVKGKILLLSVLLVGFDIFKIK